MKKDLLPEPLFETMIEKIYAIFNQRMRVNEQALATWYEELKDRIPPDAAPFITNKICKMDRLPSNMVQTWLTILPEFYVEFNRPVRENKDCKSCGGAGVRWCWAPLSDGSWRLFSTPCPDCVAEGEMGMLLDTFVEQGVKVMPPDYPCGVAGFDRDHKFNAVCKWPD